MEHRKAYDLVKHCQSKESTYIPAMSVPYIDHEKGLLVASDGFRIAIADIDTHEKPFPDYEKLIPKSFDVVLTMDIIALLEAAKVMNSGNTHMVKCTVADGELVMEADLDNIGRPITLSIPCHHITDARSGTRKPIRVALNPQYLYDCAKVMKKAMSDGRKLRIHDCTLSLNHHTNPVMFECGHYKEIIMPMFCQWE